MDQLQEFVPFDFLDPTKRVIYDENNEIIFNFGKYKGKPVAESFKKEPNYYKWMMEKEFSVFTKKAVTKIWESMNQEE
jgi:DNA polymerase-3 subunit epsilon